MDSKAEFQLQCKSRRLDNKSGPEGHKLHGTNSRGGQSFPQVLEDIPIQLPTFRPSMCPIGLHQGPKAICCSVEMQLIIYIDDILILVESKKLAREYVIGLIYLSGNLGFV